MIKEDIDLNHCLTETDFNWGPKTTGKVRDTYDLGDKLAIVTTDRQSAFDRVLAAVPYKGQVLNQCSAWWFKQTEHIIPNHIISLPDPNVTLAKKCQVFPVEFVMRGYITGTTSTSIWTQYQAGVRDYCGHKLPEGLQKNQQLPHPLLTPTTKAADHDRPISAADIINEGLMSSDDWRLASQAANALYQRGVEIAAEHGLILVDTKYEMGKDENGNILLIDEIHTPDSSRYWLKHNYEKRISEGLEPENIDKEFLRLWFVEHCDPYNDATLPKAPDALIAKLSKRYIQLYEMITNLSFSYPSDSISIHDRIAAAL